MSKSTVIFSSASFFLGFCLGSYFVKPAQQQEKKQEIRTVVQKEYVKVESQQQQQQQKIIVEYRKDGSVSRKTEVATQVATRAQTDASTTSQTKEQKKETKTTKIEQNWILGVSAPPHDYNRFDEYKVLAGYRLMPSLAIYATSSPTFQSLTVGAMVFL